MRKAVMWLILFLWLIIMLVIALRFQKYYERDTVKRVIDGDTIQLSSGKIIRLICIDAPEINKEKGKEARDFLEKLVLNKRVRLEKDSSEKDKYGRLLRYVYIESVFVNKELVKNNYASVFRYGDNVKRCDEIST